MSSAPVVFIDRLGAPFAYSVCQTRLLDEDISAFAGTQVDQAAGAKADDGAVRWKLHAIHQFTFPIHDVIYELEGRLRRSDGCVADRAASDSWCPTCSATRCPT